MTIAVNSGGVPTAALRIREALAERFDARYGDALDELVKLRRRLLTEGKADRWHECAQQVINDEFCDWSRPLGSGDRVVFIPPVAGG